MSEHGQWRNAFDDLRTTLVAAQKDRSKRQAWVADGGSGELEWVLHERQVMTDRVNLLRSRLGRSPVPMSEIAMKEHLAQGHIDYTAKWALGCADLVAPTEVPQ